jgi:hypothetical protein
MESENYTWIKSPFWLVLLLFTVACNDESKKTENTTTNVAQSTSQTKQVGFFDLPDSIIKTTVGKSVKICLPIAKGTNNETFSASTTKPPVHGDLTPSVSGNMLCLDYTPKANYSGSDEFDCKVCFTSSGYCQEKTWHIDIKNDSKGTETSSKTTSKPTGSVTKKEETGTIVPVPTSSSIFDGDKKNNDGYTPKN